MPDAPIVFHSLVMFCLSLPIAQSNPHVTTLNISSAQEAVLAVLPAWSDVGTGASITMFSQQITMPCAVVCLLLTLISGLWNANRRRESDHPSSLASLLSLTAVLVGITAAIIESVILIMRATYLTVDLIRGFPTPPPESFVFDGSGLWVLGLLWLAALTARRFHRDPRLAALALILAALFSLWAGMLIPAYHVSETGRAERTGLTVLCMVAVAGVLFVGNVAAFVSAQRNRWRLALFAPDRLACDSPAPRGFRLTCTVLAIFVFLHVGYHLAVPIRTDWLSFRLTTLFTALSAVLAAASCFMQLGRNWSAALADLGLILVSLAICAVNLLWIPNDTTTLVDRYPMVFSAMVIGLALGAGVCTWFELFWKQQLHNGEPWTVAGMLIRHVRSFSFVNAALALVIAAVLAVWPRLPWIANADESFGRIGAGLFANFVLVLTTMWSTRALKRRSQALLALLAILSTLSFVTIRILPFTAWFG